MLRVWTANADKYHAEDGVCACKWNFRDVDFILRLQKLDRVVLVCRCNNQRTCMRKLVIRILEMDGAVYMADIEQGHRIGMKHDNG